MLKIKESLHFCKFVHRIEPKSQRFHLNITFLAERYWTKGCNVKVDHLDEHLAVAIDGVEDEDGPIKIVRTFKKIYRVMDIHTTEFLVLTALAECSKMLKWE